MSRPPFRGRGALRALSILAAAAVLSGCATLRPDGGFGAVEQAARERLGAEVRWARSPADQAAIDARVAALLAAPLSADSAVQLALLNHRGLQARFEDLGIGEAERVQAGRLPNPGLSLGRSSRGGEVEIERGLHLDLARWLLLPLAAPLEARRFEQTQADVVGAVFAHAAETRKAYFRAVAAEETVRHARQVMQAAEASAELARRMAEVGNFSKLQRAREQGFYADAALNLARAEQAARALRERLTRQLGLWGAQTAFTLPPRLPELPPAARDLPDVERTAMAQRLDVQGARLAAEQTARQLGLTRRTRFVNVLEVGWMRNSSNEAPTERGWEVGFELPLFDWSGARVARAEAVYRQTLHRAADTAIAARSEVREAYGAYRSAYDIARHHRDELLPLRRLVAEENLLRYNGMLIGVFELLADARAQIAGVSAAIDAQRDFWVAQADLDLALVGRGGAPSGAASPSLSLPAAADGGPGH